MSPHAFLSIHCSGLCWAAAHLLSPPRLLTVTQEEDAKRGGWLTQGPAAGGWRSQDWGEWQSLPQRCHPPHPRSAGQSCCRYFMMPVIRVSWERDSSATQGPCLRVWMGSQRLAGRAKKEAVLCGRHRRWTALSRVGAISLQASAVGLRVLRAPDPEQDCLEDCGQQHWGFSCGAALCGGPDARTRKPHRAAASAPRTLLTTPF